MDFIAKISADKGVAFDFTNNEKIRETQFAVEGKTVNGYKTDTGITLNVQSPKYLETTVGHEITHVLEGTELYDVLSEAVKNYAISKEGLDGFNARLKAVEDLYKGVKGANPDGEVVADLVGEYIFSDTDFVNSLSTGNRDLFDKIFDEVKYLCRVVTAGSKEARQLEKVKKAFEKAYRADTKSDGGTKHSLSIRHTDGTVEELADARSLTNEQAVNYLNQAKSGNLKWDTYVPVRKDTPQVIIDTLEQVGENIENRSLVMQVRKAQQAMTTARSSRRAGKYGSNVRGHALGSEQIVEIINNLDNPSTVIYQTNRQDVSGNPLPNNVAVFVEYSNNGQESVAVIEFDSAINPESIGTEFGDTSYHTVVTVFEPDVERNGMEFDYAEELLSNPDNIELEIKRKQSERSATGKNHPNTSNELPSFNANIAQKGVGVNGKFSLSDTNSMPRGKGTLGKDVMYAPTAGESSIAPITDNAASNADNAVPNAENVLPNATVAEKATVESAYEGIPIRADIQRGATEDIGPVRADIAPPAKKAAAPLEAIAPPIREDISPRAAGDIAPPVRADIGQTAGQGSGGTRMKERSWVETSTGSEAVGGAIRKEDLDPDKLYYQPISNRKTLDNANAFLDRQGYEESAAYFNAKAADRNVSLDDVALGERLIQERMAEAGIRNMGAYVRKMALNGYVLHVDLAPVRELASLQRRCANNLNQVAIHANTYGVYPEEIAALQKDYAALWEPLSDLLEKLAEVVEM